MTECVAKRALEIAEELRSKADCDARAGEPLGKCMREAAAFIESQCSAISLCETIRENAPNGEPLTVRLWPDGDWDVFTPSPSVGDGVERQSAAIKLGSWMSAALDDPNVCEAMKADIRAWFEAGEPSPSDARNRALDEAEGWQDISSAPKDGTRIWACFHPDIFPRIKPKRDDLASWNGLQMPLRHPGMLESGFDLGWNIAAPVGHGGFPDEWIAGWMPFPPPPALTQKDSSS